MNVAQDVDGLDDTPQGRQGLGHPIRRRGVGQPLEHDVGACHPITQAGRHPHQLVPLFTKQGEIETGSQKWPETIDA